MPMRVPSNQQRYCVLSFFEKHATDPTNLIEKVDRCPLSTTLEVSKIIAPNDNFVNKRLKSFEKHVLYPYIDATFFSSFMDKRDLAAVVGSQDCINLHEPDLTMEKGLYEEVQMVDPKRDMVQTPIDDDPHLRVALDHHPQEEDHERRYKGFIINAYKTMEHMDSEDFIRNWKTWTAAAAPMVPSLSRAETILGVRYICMQLPRQLSLKRISFYRLLSETTPFKYVLLIEISNVGLYVPHTLNLLDRIKLKLCGHIGIYRNQDFTIDPISANVFGKGTKQLTPPDQTTPEVSVPLPGERLLTLSQDGRASISKVIGDRKELVKQFDIYSEDESEVNILGDPLQDRVEADVIEEQELEKLEIDRVEGEGAGAQKRRVEQDAIPTISPREKAREKQLLAWQSNANRTGQANVEVRIHAPRASLEDDLEIGDGSLRRKKGRSPIANLASKIRSPSHADGKKGQSNKRSPGSPYAANLDESISLLHVAKTSPKLHPRLMVNDRVVGGIPGNVYVKLPVKPKPPRSGGPSS